jgi:hypothetical protein
MERRGGLRWRGLGVRPTRTHPSRLPSDDSSAAATEACPRLIITTIHFVFVVIRLCLVYLFAHAEVSE